MSVLEPEIVSPMVRPTEPEDIQIHGISERDWQEVCEMLARGVKIQKALDDLFIPQPTYRVAMSQNAELRKRIQAARAIWDNRNWPEEKILEIFNRVAGGETLKDVAEGMGFVVQNFHALRHRDSYVQETYDLALKIQAEGFLDEMRAIVDERENDVLMDKDGGQRANSAAPQRDRLRFEMRKWAVSKLLREKYGEKLDVDMKHDVTGNLADRLNAARLRRESAHARQIGSGDEAS